MSEAHAEPQAPVVDDHHHGTTPAEDDNVNVGAVALWFFVIIAFIIAAFTFAHEYFGIQIRKQVSEKVLSAGSPQLRDLQAKEQASLGKYQWVDKQAGVVRVPVDRAKELVLRDWGSRAAAAAAAAKAAEEVPSDQAEGSPAEESAPKNAEPSEGEK